MKHYDAVELDLYRNKELSPLKTLRCKMHLKKCPECRQLLKTLDDDDVFLDEVKKCVKDFSELPECKTIWDK